MNVILAEKPDMGRNIAQALGIKKKDKGFIELTNGDIVTWAIGHIIRLKTPDTYREYQKWSMDSLPILPDPMLSEVDPDKKAQFHIIKGLLDQSDCCIIATDPGREGEHIGRTILEACRYKGQIKRLWIDDLTPNTIKAGFRNLKDGSDTANLGKAAKVRAYADYWMGFTATRFFTLTAAEITRERAVLSAGRVQTPTLRIVYDRELAIENFVSKPFYGLTANFQAAAGSYQGQWFKETEEGKATRFDTKEEAEQIRKKVEGHPGTITHFEEKRVKRQAPQLLHSTSIKTAARSEYGFGIEETMKLLQSIYDKGFVTYPRTSSRHLSENAADQLATNLQAIANGKYKALFPDEIQSLKGKSRFVNDQKAKEHHAIVPTGKDPSGLLDKEEQLYRLVLRYTLAAHYPEGIDKETIVITSVEGETFATKGVVRIQEGWRRILKPQSEDKEQQEKVAELPQLKDGLQVKAASFETTTGKTTPPKRLADSDLEKAMENAGQIVDDVEDDEVLHHLKECGIGTPATRTHIIQELIHQEYIEIRKNLVHLTDKGRHFIQLIHDHPLASIELTGEFEKKLNEVAEGKRSAAATLDEFKTFAHDILKLKDELQQNIQQTMQEGKPLFQKEVEAVGDCPKCGKPVVARDKFYGCTGFKDGCKFTLPKSFIKVNLTSKMVQHLLSGTEILLQNIPGQYGAYSLFVSLKGDQLETRKPSTEDLSLGNCPLCKCEVLEKEKFYGCSGYKAGCKFTLPKEFLGKKLTPGQIKKLLKNGKTDKIKGFTGKKGTFDTALGYDKEAKRLSFVN